MLQPQIGLRREAELAIQLDRRRLRHALQQELIESEQRASEERKAAAQESSQPSAARGASRRGMAGRERSPRS